MLTSCLILMLIPGYVTVDPGDVRPIRGEPIVQPKSKVNSGEVLFCLGTYGEA